MEIFWVLVITLSVLIFVFIYGRHQMEQHNDWLNAWRRLAEIGSIRDEDGNLVRPQKFNGFFRGRSVEIRVVSFSGYEFGAPNVYTNIAIQFDHSLDGYVYLSRKVASGTTQSHINVKEINNFFQIISTSQKLEEIFLPYHLKKKLLRLPIERVQVGSNRVIFLIPGVETEVDILFQCLLLLDEIAKNSEVNC